MKEIIISADGDSVVYSVPDDVANQVLTQSVIELRESTAITKRISLTT